MTFRPGEIVRVMFIVSLSDVHFNMLRELSFFSNRDFPIASKLKRFAVRSGFKESNAW